MTVAASLDSSRDLVVETPVYRSLFARSLGPENRKASRARSVRSNGARDRNSEQFHYVYEVQLIPAVTYRL